VIPTIIIQLLNGETEIQLGDLRPTRDLLFVKDTANAFVAIAKAESLVGEDCNIATQSEISVKDLAQELINQINPAAKIITDDERLRPNKSEVFRLYGDNKKITEHTGWKQQYSLQEGLEATINWFRNPENLKQYKANIYNI
jgi:nucleoside-diphosphate-sugar epimerase